MITFHNATIFISILRELIREHNMGQSIQEWTKRNLQKTAFKDLKGYGLLK